MFHYTILLEYVDTKLIGKTANSYKFMTFCLKFNQTIFLLGKLPNTFHFPQNKLSYIELNNNENLDLWNTLFYNFLLVCSSSGASLSGCWWDSRVFFFFVEKMEFTSLFGRKRFIAI